MDNKKIGLFITNLRKEKNMTQKALANKLYVSDKAVSKWERGICMPDIALMEKLADILDVSVGDILKGERIEKVTKQNFDEIVKDSIPFYQRDYLKKKLIKIIICLIIFLPFGYLSLLTIGEFNNGKISWSIWGNESYIEVPTFSLIKAKINTKQYLKAIQNDDYETIEIMLKENEARDYSLYNDWIDFDEYIDALKVLKKEGVKLTKYNLLYCYKYNIYTLDYNCAYDLTFEYQGTDYGKGVGLTNYNGKISVNDVVLTPENYNYWNKKNYRSIYAMKDKELINNIEKLFFKY